MRGSIRCRLRRLRRISGAASGGPPTASSTRFETSCKALGQLRFAYRLLCTSDVIGNAPELERSLAHIPDAVARHGYAVTRLPDAAGIHKRGAGEPERVDTVVV